MGIYTLEISFPLPPEDNMSDGHECSDSCSLTMAILVFVHLLELIPNCLSGLSVKFLHSSNTQSD